MARVDQDVLLSSNSLSDFLRKEYLARLNRNASYSMRAFARDLGVSPSRLSEGLNQKKGFSLSTVDKMAQRLKLTKTSRETFRDLQLAQDKRRPAIRKNALDRITKMKNEVRIKKLELDRFKVISDWYHMAIVEMTELANFKSDVEWIASRLSISKEQARAAVNRLLALSLIVEKGGRWVAHPDIFATSHSVSSQAIRRYHRQMLELASQSLQNDPVNIRDINSMILAIPQARLEDFREQIVNFMKDFWKQAKEHERDSIYALNIQLFPLTDKDQAHG